MTDIEKFREEVLDHLREAKDQDLLAQASAGGLAMMFNRMAPSSRAIHPHEWGGQTLEEKMPRLMEEKRQRELGPEGSA